MSAKTKRLADACRELVFRLPEIELGAGMGFDADDRPCCAIGHVLVIAGYGPNDPSPFTIDITIDVPLGPVVKANDLSAPGDERRNAVIAPLLDLADELDSL